MTSLEKFRRVCPGHVVPLYSTEGDIPIPNRDLPPSLQAWHRFFGFYRMPRGI